MDDKRNEDPKEKHPGHPSYFIISPKRTGKDSESRREISRQEFEEVIELGKRQGALGKPRVKRKRK